MTTALISHTACEGHDPQPHHPESPARLRAIAAALSDPEFDNLLRHDAPFATREQLIRAHPEQYVDYVSGHLPSENVLFFDPDTAVAQGSEEAVLRAAGAVPLAVDLVMEGQADNAFCAVRPPGHHAEPHKAMGFCLFNNIVVGAEHARAVYGVERVAVVDFDVHHGNGTQAAFWADRNAFFGSTHQSPFYPGTGAVGESGEHDNVVNAPLSAFADGGTFREAMRTRIFPAIRDFSPDLIMISAGFDGHKDDPLAQLCLIEKDYDWITRELCDLADQLCEGRLISVLEGGYNLDALAMSVAAHARALLDV